MIMIAAIFVALFIIVRSYKHIDKSEVSLRDLLIALALALVAIGCLTLRETYFALPDNTMVSEEYLKYRSYLTLGFMFLMGYIVRALIYGVVHIYRKRN